MRIVVIGSGFGGLAAAIRLQAQGHDVTIVEKLKDKNNTLKREVVLAQQ